MALSLFTFIALMSQTTSKFFSNQMVIKLAKRQYPVKDVPFPAVTFCPDYVIPIEFYKSHGKSDEG
jgi:hypothetical protein